MTRRFKNIAALALMVGALIGSVGTSDAQNYRYQNNAYGWGPAYNNGVYRSSRAMAPMPPQRGYSTDSFNNQPKCWVSPASINYVPCF
jgi:hypothetical protein